ncbi:sensor histidine kinase [Marinomonas ostreistagni]|uniref:sensor histidine kinase n=1 Tax=Marinomonas ostreistagni TaxID=359209 RepID=UPI00194FEC6B|nr:HAMP domain-containing sensor histidine kinase [Marinomonas ostreistagni]MBM6550580.1 sensor histidine kinase [Marinomonas ostreistagni]
MPRLFWLWLVLLGLIFSALGVTSYQLSTRQSQVGHRQVQERLVTQASVIFSRELGHIDQIVRFMRAETQLLIPDSYPNIATWRSDVAEHFDRFHLLSEHIAQLRWLSPQGVEQVRLNVINGQVQQVPPNALQNKSNRYYFLQGLQTRPGEIFLSPIDLNVEAGQIVEPYEVTLRAVTKLHNAKGELLGLLVLNYNLNSLLQRLAALQTPHYTLEMMNSRGHWLLSYRPEWAWQHLLSEPQGSFPNQYPEAWVMLQTEQALIATDLDQDRPAIIQPNELEDDRLTSSEVYYFVSQLTPTVWQTETRQRFWATLLITLLSFILSAVVSFYAWHYWQQRRRYVRQIELDKCELEDMYQSLSHANERLVSLQAELVEQSKMSALGMMVAGVGHELNTPLGGIRMSLSSLPHMFKRLHTDHPNEVAVMQDTLDIANQNLTRAIETVSQFKRITEQRMHQDQVHFDVHAMVQDVLAPLKPMLKNYPHASISNQVAPGMTWLAAPGVLSQVLQNLIMNALEHAFEPEQSGTITIVASIEEHYVIAVIDDGKGIAEELIETIWEPFVTTGRGKQHTGLGLYMVYQWVTNLLGGSIDVQSSPEGTRFTLYLPIPEAADELT